MTVFTHRIPVLPPLLSTWDTSKTNERKYDYTAGSYPKELIFKSKIPKYNYIQEGIK